MSPLLWDGIGNDMEIRGLDVRVDLAGGVVEEVFDAGARPVGAASTSVAASSPARPLRPLIVSQPNGPSFSVRGSEILWDRWRLHFGVHPRRGLEIFDVAIVDGNQTRPVLYRAGLSELMTPYGDPEYVSWYPRDAGDYGMSLYSATRASAIVGADAPANAVFAPAVFTDPRGRPVTVPRVVAIYERDGGVLWRHSNRASRSRQLVLSGYTTIDNYDYLFHWVFSQDGAIDVQSQLTGVMNVRPVAAARDAAHARRCDDVRASGGAARARAQSSALLQLAARLRRGRRGQSRARAEHLERAGHASRSGGRVVRHAADDAQERGERTPRHGPLHGAPLGRGQRHTKTNALGQHTGYALVPGENAPAFQAPGSGPRRRAAFLEHHLWVTLFDPRQMYASGEWVNLMREREGVEMWGADDRSIVDRDVVLWYTNSVLHLPRPEDWPVMPAHTAGFRLVPIGFFASNPTAPAK